MKQSSEDFPAPAREARIIRDKSKATGYGAGDIVGSGLLDRTGNLWFVTSNEGVYRYDGKSFRNYTKADGLNSNNVCSVLEAKDGILWFGTDDGLCKYGWAATACSSSTENNLTGSTDTTRE